MIRKFFNFLFIPAIFLLVIVRCGDDDPATEITGIVDVTGRITSMPSILGTGDTMVIEGTGFDKIERIVIGTGVILIPNQIIFTETGIKFKLPATVPNGENDIMFVFKGNERAFGQFEVLARQTFSWIDPEYGSAGDTVRVYGTNLYVVTSLKVGNVDAQIIAQPGTYLDFVVPGGASPAKVQLITNLLTVESTNDFIACENSVDLLCMPNLILNEDGSFERGTYGLAASDANIGTGWYAAGLTGGSPRQYIRILPMDSLPTEIRNYPDLGTKIAKITLNENYLANELTDVWQIQLVNTVDPVEVDRSFKIKLKIWADRNGRQIKVHGGVATPAYADMTNDSTYTLAIGWNELTSKTISHIAGQDEDHVRVQLSYGLQRNRNNCVFYLDDVRLIDVGPAPTE